jgi:hypothetical protein
MISVFLTTLLHTNKGFFRCNRWVEQKEHEAYDVPPDIIDPMATRSRFENIADPTSMEITYGTAMHESRAAKAQSRKMARFLHHYQRWDAHAESAALERNMRETVCTRLAPVVRQAIEFNGDEHVFGGKGISFIHSAFSELLECRSMLQHSYAFSFFRYKSTNSRKYKLLKRRANEKATFEQFQSELELLTEQISDVVARSHIRATQTQIAFLTAATSEKRKEFSNVMINILIEEKREEEEANRGKESDSKRGINGLPGSLLGNVVGLVSEPVSAGASRIESDDSDNIDDAVRESLAEFLARSESDFLDYTSDGESDWACLACTYVNAGGRRCEMCGTAKAR